MRPSSVRTLLYPLTTAMLSATIGPTATAVSLPTAPIEINADESAKVTGNRQQRRAQRAIEQRERKRRK